MKKFLHIGPGDSYKSNTSKIFATDEWEEVRLDINEKANPDILTSMTDLSMIEDDEYQGIFPRIILSIFSLMKWIILLENFLEY